MKKQAVLSLSGGMDSSTLLLHLLANNYEVTALSFYYGQKHKIELERAQELISYLRTKGYHVKHQIITLQGLMPLLNSALVTGNAEVPEGHYAEENMKATVVPNRNKMFSSIIQAVALSIATASDEKQNVLIALGIHAGDHAIYPDCRQEFRDADMHAFKLGNWDSELVDYYTPYLSTDKYGILQDGLDCCDQLKINFDEVYRRTNTSYKPIEKNGKYFSDYKSASSVERVEAFLKLGRKDPVAYADETGEVSWDTVTKHVGRVLTTH
jgi:7-cyano-7-deazaguanine synthase